MKINYSLPLFSIAATFALTLSHARADTVITNENLPYQVPVQIGSYAFAPGDNITITEVRGTSDQIQIGGRYSVEGTYTLSSKDQATLGFHSTSLTNIGPTPTEPTQTMPITNGTGSFYLVKTVSEDGYLHVSFYTGSDFGGVYFGQGDRVFNGPMSVSSDSGSSTNNSSDSANSNSSGSSTNSSNDSSSPSGANPNQALYDYLGNPVMPPANMDPRYTVSGLTDAIQQAAQKAGITVKGVGVDYSEFPFLVGVICGGSDFAKLKAALRTMPGYHYGGGVGNDTNSDGSDTLNVFCIVPSSAYPRGTGTQIYHRLILREAVFQEQAENGK